MSSPAHRAAVGFAQGGLIAVVAQVIAAPVAGATASIPGLAPFSWLVRAVVPVAGFAAAGAVGGAAMEDARASTAFAAGLGLTGVLLTATSPHLGGLTGYENPIVVVSYALLTSSLAFGAGGAVASGILRTGAFARTAMAFAIGGAIGAILGVLPFLVARVAWFTGPAALSFSLATSIGSVVVPLGLGGALTARALDRG